MYETSTYNFSLTHSDPISTRSQWIIAPFLRKLTILRHRKPLQSSSLHQRLSLWSTSFSTRLDCFYRPFASIHFGNTPSFTHHTQPSPAQHPSTCRRHRLSRILSDCC